jgi:NAD+ synthase
MKFDPKAQTEKIIQFIRDYYKKFNLGGVVIGISGGKDSGVVAGLFAKAIGPENVIGVTLPCHSKNIDATDAKLVADKYGFKLINLDLTNVFDVFEDEAKKIDDFVESEDSAINLKPRLRMSALYYIAQMYTKKTGKGYIVAGTGNKCEEFVGYFTKGGDGVSDIKTIADLTVEEVIKVGEVVEVPEAVLYKAPSDGLSGKTDEDRLGFAYADVAKVIYGEEVDPEVKERILRKHENNKHKFEIPTYRK